jgi:hypothetical protein
MSKVNELLGFDPTVQTPISKAALNEVIVEVQKQRAAKAKERAKESVKKLLEYVDEISKLEASFIASKAAAQESIDKIMGELEAELNK